MQKSSSIPILLFSVIAALAIAFAPKAFAQVRDTDISLDITPAYPSPNQDVSAVLSSQATDLDKTLITWTQDGVKKLSGMGKKEFRFNSGNFGSPTSISASIDFISGNSLIKNIVVWPAEVDMLYEAADSYVPPFYKGLSLPANQSKIKVVAIPFLSIGSGVVSDTNLSYAWTKDGKGQPQGSGWNGSSFIFQNSYLDDGNTVSVQVSDITGNATGAGNIKLNTINPKIIFYPWNSVSGADWNHAIPDGFTVPSSGETIFAAPYFFSETDPNSSGLSYIWTLNGQQLDTPNPQNILAVKPASGTSGNADIKLTINNIGTLFQNVSQELNVNF